MTGRLVSRLLGMASNSPGGGDGVIDIVCGALRAKLNSYQELVLWH